MNIRNDVVAGCGIGMCRLRQSGCIAVSEMPILAAVPCGKRNRTSYDIVPEHLIIATGGTFHRYFLRTRVEYTADNHAVCYRPRRVGRESEGMQWDWMVTYGGEPRIRCSE